MTVGRNKTIFEQPPVAVPAGNVDVSGGGRWKIWQDAGTKIDAPILGNGDMLAALAGNARFPQFWITTNDFWQMESAASWEFFHDNASAKCDPAMGAGSPRPVGRIVFDIPELDQAKWYTEQDFLTATTTTVFTEGDGKKCVLKSWIAAMENVLVVEFCPEMDLNVEYDFYFPDETGKGCNQAADIWGSGESEEIQNGMFVGMVSGKPLQVKQIRGNIVSGYRQFSDHVDMPTKVGFAGCFIEDPKSRDFTCRTASRQLKAGEKAFFVLPVRSWEKYSRPYEYAVSRARWMTVEEVEKLRSCHLSWWKRFWSVSEITLDDPVIEQRYYLSKYMLASVSRDPEYPPNILGISTFDRPAWNGNYKINYNHQSPYLNLMVSGHFSQSDPHDSPYLKLMDISSEMSERLLQHEGLYYPLGLGPHGVVSEALLLHMKSPALHGALNMIFRYRLTEDKAYAEKIYPFLRGIADFWEKDLVYRDGFYHVTGDGMHERTDENIREAGIPEDPVNTLGYLKTFYTWMPAISEALEVDQEKREVWTEIAGKLAEFPRGTIREIQDNPTLWTEADVTLEELLPEEVMDTEIYYDEGVGGKWSFHFPGNVMQIYPGSAIGLSSPKEELETARNTVHIHALVERALGEFQWKKAKEAGEEGKDPHFYKAGAFNASNLSCLFFTAAARVGYEPEIIWEEMREMILHRGLPNGFLKENPHGIEELNTIPDAIQEMMFQSHEGILRIFPVWPKTEHPNASFKGFRGCGAFEVDASLKRGEVEEIVVISHMGHPCVMENPWEKGEGELIRSDGRREKLSGEIWSIPMQKEETVKIRK